MCKWRYFLLFGILLCLVVFLATSCTTSFAEWSGDMSNQTGRHVSPYDPNNAQSPRPARRITRIPQTEQQ